MKNTDEDFCTRRFTPAIVVMVLLIIVIVGWTLWRMSNGALPPVNAAQVAGLLPAAVKKPSGPPVDINAKMLHADWGNCNKCHISTGKAKKGANIMPGPPVSIAQTATHPYWGNCLLCHKVFDGFQPKGAWVDSAATQAQAAAQLSILKAHPYVTTPQPAPSLSGLLVVAANSPSLSATVAPQFDTASYFVLIDPVRQGFRIEDNPNAGVPGYGVQNGQLMANLRVTGVVAGGFSPAALSTLGSLRIAAYPGVAGSVRDALAAYQAGGLAAAQTTTQPAAPAQLPVGAGQTRF